MIRILAVSFLTMTLVACAHHRDVRRGSEGVNRVVVEAEDQESGIKNAMAQAKHYCSEKNQEAEFITEKETYKGDVEESTYKKAKTATKVASVVGGAAAVFGGRNERAAGGLALLGGAAGRAALGKGYQVEMTFRCVN